MAVVLTDEEFEWIYSTFERMMSIETSVENTHKLILEEDKIWAFLKSIKDKADRGDARQPSEPRRIESGLTARSASR